MTFAEGSCGLVWRSFPRTRRRVVNPSTASNEATNLLPSMLTLGAHVGAYVRKRNAPREVFLVVAIDAETKNAQLRTRFMEDAAQSIVACVDELEVLPKKKRRRLSGDARKVLRAQQSRERSL